MSEDFKDALIEYVSAGLLVLEESPEMYWRLKSHADKRNNNSAPAARCSSYQTYTNYNKFY